MAVCGGAYAASSVSSNCHACWSQLLNRTPNQVSKSFARRMRNNLLARSPTVERAFWNSGLPGDFAERVARLFETCPERIGVLWHRGMRTLAPFPRGWCSTRLRVFVSFSCFIQEGLIIPGHTPPEDESPFPGSDGSGW